MKKLVLVAIFVIASAASSNATAAENPFEKQEYAARLLLGSAGFDGKVVYKVGVPDDYGKISNMWVFVVTNSPESDMDTLAYVLSLAVSLDGSIPNRTDYVTIAHNGMMYIAPMPETRRCIKGVGVAGFECAKEHMRAGRLGS